MRLTTFWFAILFLLLSTTAFGQKEGNIWYFGDYAGVDFNPATPAILNNSAMTTLEGCATISDADGELLFYTDGGTVWNKNHVTMQNGSGLMGDASSTQSAVIVPDPTDGDIFYIFTVDACQNNLANGIRYSKVDMSANAGLGKVDLTEKNILLAQPVAEKISAVGHYNQQSVWVLTHGYNNNTFYAFLIDENGVNTTPQTYDVGLVHYGTNDPWDACGDLGNARGYMKASPDGSKIAVAIGRSENFEIVDFNNSTGEISNPVTFTGYTNTYGVEFSPDGSKLYLSTQSTGTGVIYQVDLDNGNLITQVGSASNSFGALQIASDQNIYATRVGTNYLAVIEEPDEAGTACDYSNNGIYLGSGTAQYGLPTFIQSFFYNPEFSAENVCFRDTTQFYIQDLSNVDSMRWNFDDPTTGIHNSSTLVQPWHIFSAPGVYEVELTVHYPTVTEVLVNPVTIRVADVDLGEDTEFCENGSINASNGFVSYEWSTGSTSQVIGINTTGEYSITVTDSYGCMDSDTIMVTINSNPEIVSEDINTGCAGQNNASITVQAGSGTTPYQYALDDGAFQTSPTFSNVISGSHTLKVKDAKNCETSKDVAFTEPPALDISLTKTDIDCYGDAVGTVDATVSGGVTPYTFQWSNGANTEDLTNLFAAEYELLVTDINGCQITDSIEVVQNEQIVFDAETQGVSCKSWSDGQIIMDVSGGLPAYTFDWSNGETTESISNLTAGTYTLTVTDNLNCMISEDYLIDEPTFAFEITNANITHVRCYSGSDGEINMSVSGGQQPYSYEWSNGETTQDIDHLVKDTYYVVATDARNCRLDSMFVVDEPDAPLWTNVVGQSVSCRNGSDGAIDLTITGGTPPYEYLWSNSLTTQDIDNLTAGFYSVVANDINNCVITDTITIWQPPTELIVTTEQTNIICKGGNNGAIDLTASGGIPAYSYAWSNGETTPDLNLLTAGTYTYNVSDENGCVVEDSVEITEPQYALAFSDIIVQDVSCYGENNGSVEIGVVGGVQPYEISWSNNSSTTLIDELYAGAYTVTVTDANSCSITNTSIVTQPQQPLELVLAKTDIECHGDNNGTIDATVTGGTTDYTFIWSNGADTEDLTNLQPGKYILTVIDENNCSVTDSVTIFEPAAPLNLTYAKQDVNCKNGSDGSIDITVTGGTQEYSYAWSTGATTQDIQGISKGMYSVQVTDENGCTISQTMTIDEPVFELSISDVMIAHVNCLGGNDGAISLDVTGGTVPYNYTWSNNATTQDIENLMANTYSLLITDDNGCEIDSSFVIEEPPTAMELELQTTDADCNGASNGAIDLTVTGGTQPYTYLWSSGAVTEDITSLTAGPYTVTVTDANGCEAIGETYVNSSLIVTIVETPVSCYGLSDGFLNLNVTGGTPNYTFAWSTGATTEDIGNLPAGSYSVTVTDAAGCIVEKIQPVTEPDFPLSTGMEKYDVNCYNGSDGYIDLIPVGGTQPYYFIWSNNATTEDLVDVQAGYYAVTIRDDRGCETDTFTTLFQPDTPLVMEWTNNNIQCYGESTGYIDLTVEGGTPPYTYNWSNGAVTQDLDNLTAGKYYITVTDNNNCQITDSITINQPSAEFLVEVDKQNVRCYGENNGSIDLTVTGGTPGYTYNWSNGATVPDLYSLSAGVYSVEITDTKNCLLQKNILIEEPFELGVDYEITGVDCYGDKNGSLYAEATGGTPGYSYQWSTGDTTQFINQLRGGKYYLSVVDTNLCTKLDSVIVPAPEAPLDLVFDVSNVKCFGGNTGEIDLTVTGGTPDFSYNWSNGQDSEDINALVEGMYAVVVVDAHGCTVEDSTKVIEPDEMLELSVDSSNINCNGAATGIIDLTITGGIQPYSFQWDNGATSEDLYSLPAGEYNVVVTDSFGCAIPRRVILTEPFAIQIDADITHVDCYGGNDGSIDLSVTGGVPDYIYSWSNDSTTQDLAALKAGTYIVMVRDYNWCTVSSTIEVTQPDAALSLAFDGTDVDCYGESSGAIDLTVSGGTPGYYYLWSNGAQIQDITSVPSGMYSVIVVDDKNCIEEDSLFIAEPPELLVEYMKSNVKCHGGNDGVVELTVSGGTPSYNYLWSNGAETRTISNLEAGLYSVIVTDLNDCTVYDTARIDQALEIMIDYSTTFSCFGADDGTIDIDVAGGVPPYEFLWSNDEDTEDLHSLRPGEYTVFVTDFNNCVQQETILVQEPSAIAVEPTVYPASCTSVPNGEILLEVLGGTPPYSYNWLNLSDNTEYYADELEAGFYTVTISDSKSCDSTYRLEVPILYENCVGLYDAFTPNGDGINDTWFIEGIEFFPDADIFIYDRYGHLLAQYKGADEPWDGTYNGETLPTDTYYFVIDLNAGYQQPVQGTVTLIR